MRAAITIDSNSAVPLHRQIYDAWRADILAGRFERGARLPSTRELAKALNIARSTVSQAYEQLTSEGYLQPTHGAGTFVCRELPEEVSRVAGGAPTGTHELSEIRLSKFAARLTEDFIYAPQLPTHISFARWVPDIAEFPINIWRKLVTRALRKATPLTLGYARESQGSAELREEIAAYVARSRAVRCSAEQVVILNGSQQALDFCARLLAEPGDLVAFENPGYLGTRRIFHAHGLKLQPASIDSEGIVLRNLKRARLVYVTPSHQFPTGVSMSLKRRLELLNWARAQRAVIIEDDYDSEYRYSGAPLPSLQGLAGDVPVVYCGTFSKVMFPGLRIGYAIVPPQLVAPFARAKWITDRHTPMIEQIVLTDFIRDGHLERHIRRMRRIYGHRREVLIEALHKYFGERAKIVGDAAGMHVMVRIEGERNIQQRAARNRVQVVDAATYYLGAKSGKADNELLFGFSCLGDRAIREGIKRLAQD